MCLNKSSNAKKGLSCLFFFLESSDIVKKCIALVMFDFEHTLSFFPHFYLRFVGVCVAYYSAVFLFFLWTAFFNNPFFGFLFFFSFICLLYAEFHRFLRAAGERTLTTIDSFFFFKPPQRSEKEMSFMVFLCAVCRGKDTVCTKQEVRRGA